MWLHNSHPYIDYRVWSKSFWVVFFVVKAPLKIWTCSHSHTDCPMRGLQLQHGTMWDISAAVRGRICRYDVSATLLFIYSFMSVVNVDIGDHHWRMTHDLTCQVQVSQLLYRLSYRWWQVGEARGSRLEITCHVYTEVKCGWRAEQSGAAAIKWSCEHRRYPLGSYINEIMQ